MHLEGTSNVPGVRRTYLKGTFCAQPDGIHTQRIESSWRPAKDWFRTRKLPGYRFGDALVEYQWRRECRKNKLDPFEQLLGAIKREYVFE
jgi:hypothetical protein